MEFTLSPRFHSSANKFSYRVNISRYTVNIFSYRVNKISLTSNSPNKNFSHKNHTPQLNKTSEFFYLLLVEAKIFLLKKGHLAESTYDLILNKRHSLGPFS